MKTSFKDIHISKNIFNTLEWVGFWGKRAWEWGEEIVGKKTLRIWKGLFTKRGKTHRFRGKMICILYMLNSEVSREI